MASGFLASFWYVWSKLLRHEFEAATTRVIESRYLLFRREFRFSDYAEY